MKIITEICFIVIFCVIALKTLNVIEPYRDRAMLEVKTELSIQTVNGDSADFANLSASKEVEKTSEVFINFIRFFVLIVSGSGTYYIVSKNMKRKNKDV